MKSVLGRSTRSPRTRKPEEERATAKPAFVPTFLLGIMRKEGGPHMDFVEHLLVVLTLLAAAAINGWLGFLGIVVGAYRMNTLVTFSSVYQMKKREFWAAHRSGDVSTLVAALVFVHIGFVLLLLITFGPKGQEKSTQSNIRIR